jgi:hypothetical protein
MKKASITRKRKRVSALREVPKRPKTRPSKIKLTGPIPRAKGNASIVAALLAGREEER